jgi:hypothetical protein
MGGMKYLFRGQVGIPGSCERDEEIPQQKARGITKGRWITKGRGSLREGGIWGWLWLWIWVRVHTCEDSLGLLSSSEGSRAPQGLSQPHSFWLPHAHRYSRAGGHCRTSVQSSP